MPRRPPLSVCLAFAALFGGAALAHAQSPTKELRAFHITTTRPHIDGQLDDEVWRLAAIIDDFVQMDPDNMEPATERTTAQVAYDDRYLYVAVRCYFKNVGDVSTGLGRRDNIPRSDRVIVAFDPRHDHQTGYAFQVNPSGVLGDYSMFDDTRTSFDYDGVWDAGTKLDSDGWSAELRIPFSQMRFSVPSTGQATWGFNVERQIARTGENVRWVATPRGVQGLVSRFGVLVFGDRLTPPRRIELLPFALASTSRDTSSDPVKDKSLVNGGFDLRVGLGTSTTLSATINPDFGQVEADPAVLNLSVFETFFPEKRPFFLEDSRILVLPYGQMPDFYSRRIGQRPGRIELKDEETLIRKPDQTTILGAAKLTGKASGWTYGGLSALTSREYAVVDRTITAPDGTTSTVRSNHRLVEPLTFYGVGRVQRDIMGSSSNVGMVATTVVRGDKELDAFTGGPDYNLRWNQNRFNVNGHIVATHAPIDGQMRDGYGHVQNFNFNSKHVNAYTHFDHIDKNFRNSDLGFLGSRVDKNEMNIGGNLMRPDPGKYFRELSWWAGYNRGWNSDGLVFQNNWNSEIFLRFRNYWWTDVGGWQNTRRYDDLDTRGGPPIVKPAETGVYVNMNTDTRKTWGVFIHADGAHDEAHGWHTNFNPTFRVQPSNRLQASLTTGYTLARDAAQWIKNEDLNEDGTDENIYGTLRRHVVNVTGRATFAFSPTMTLEAFLQPFVAVGDYTEIRKLAQPKSYEFAPVALADDPDFNRKSLRGTIVMRWEYRPGSTLFAVWNTATLDETRAGMFSLWHDLGSGFGASGTNVFVVKLSYWFTP